MTRYEIYVHISIISNTNIYYMYAVANAINRGIIVESHSGRTTVAPPLRDARSLVGTKLSSPHHLQALLLRGPESAYAHLVRVFSH